MSLLNKYCPQPQLNVSTLSKVNTLFLEQKWMLDKENISGLYNRFCLRLSQLTPDEQELIIELTKRFLVIPQQEYLKYFLDIIHNPALFQNSIITGCTNLFILPLISKEDIGKIKSSSFLWYALKSTEVKYDPFFAQKNLTFCENPNNLATKINNDAQSCLVLVDDYIGSGKTAESAVSYCASFGITPQKIAIVAIAAQQVGIDSLQAANIPVYTNTILNRGISDWYANGDLTNAIRIMRKIEKKLQVTPKFKFGYDRSEALVSLSRTPNNTFPVFWWENDMYNVSPFPRY